LEVHTQNFHVTSSFGDGPTRDLARDLEVFHAGVMAALGLDFDAQRRHPTRVIAFDGRGLSRPFSERGESASLIPTIDGPILMIRASGGFRERVGPDLRHRYAHRILRDLTKEPLPLWYEEGRAQLAATIEQRDDMVLVGRSNPEFRDLLLDWRHQDMTMAMGRHNLANASAPDRARFEASSWAIVQTILFDSSSKRRGAEALDAVRAASESRAPGPLQKAIAALGSADELTARIYDHLEADRHRVDRLGVTGLVSADFDLDPVPPAVARDRLAGLALDLERPGLAEQYFERALRDRSDYAPSLAGLALADAVAGRLDRIDERVARVATSADSDAVAASRVGLALAIAAAGMPAGKAQTDRLRLARTFLERSLQIEPGRIEAQKGLGLSFLVEGTQLVRAREWFEAARRQSPGSLELKLWLARVQLRLRRPNSARSGAEEAISRSHSVAIRESGRSIIEEAEALSAR